MGQDEDTAISEGIRIFLFSCKSAYAFLVAVFQDRTADEQGLILVVGFVNLASLNECAWTSVKTAPRSKVVDLSICKLLFTSFDFSRLLKPEIN